MPVFTSEMFSSEMFSSEMWAQGVADTSWTPAQLFAGGWQGFYADPIDGRYVFSDTAGATPAPLGGTAARLDAPPGSPVAASFSNGTVPQQPVRRADGLEFDGVDDYLSYPDDPALRFGTTDFTLAAAVKPDNLAGGQQCLLTKRGLGGAGTTPGWGLRTISRSLMLEYDHAGAPSFPIFGGNSALSDGTWTDSIVQLDYSSGEVVAYFDNVAVAPQVVPVGDISGTQPVTLGRSPPTGDRLFDGIIGRTFAINRLLTPAERAKLNAWLKEPHA